MIGFDRGLYYSALEFWGWGYFMEISVITRVRVNEMLISIRKK